MASNQPFATIEVEDEDEPDDSLDVLDPELAAIFQHVASHRPEPSRSPIASTKAGDEVVLTIRMVASPRVVRNASNERGLRFYEAPFTATLGAVRSGPGRDVRASLNVSCSTTRLRPPSTW